MKKPVKILLGVVVVLLVLIIGAVVLISVFGEEAIRSQVEVQATKALQTPVTLGGLHFSLLQGSGDLQNLTVDNLPGYQHEKLMELGEVYVDVGLKTLMQDPIHIEHVKLDNIKVVLEQKGLTNNIEELLKKLPKSEEPEPQVEEEEKKPGKQLVIDKLEINGVEVSVKMLPVPGKVDTITLKLNPIVMEGLGTGERMDVGRLTKEVFLAIVGGILEQGGQLPGELFKSLEGAFAGLGELGKQVLDQTGIAVEGTIKEAGKALEGTGKVLEDQVKDVGKGLDDIGKGLEGIFKKKEEPAEEK